MPFFQPAFSIQSLFVALSVLPWYLGWLEDILSFHMLDVPEWWPWFFVWAEPREKRPWMLNCMFSYHNICLRALPQVYFDLPLTNTNQSLLKTCQTKKQMLQLLKIVSNIYSEPASRVTFKKLCFFCHHECNVVSGSISHTCDHRSFAQLNQQRLTGQRCVNHLAVHKATLHGEKKWTRSAETLHSTLL